jgi:hypothetical protein
MRYLLSMGADNHIRYSAIGGLRLTHLQNLDNRKQVVGPVGIEPTTSRL